MHLSSDQRATLEQLPRTGTTTAAAQRHARILLKAETTAHGPAWDDTAIAAAGEASVPTVPRGRRQVVTDGLEMALHPNPTTRASQPKLDGVQEASLAAIACRAPPEDADRWTLALLKEKLVDLKSVDTSARETVRIALKPTTSSRG